MKWYNRKGEQITEEEYIKLRYKKDKYFIVKQEKVGDYWISTVWLGIDHCYTFNSDGKPVIFETMVFDHSEDSERPWRDLDEERYCTEEEALKGHNKIVKKYV